MKRTSKKSTASQLKHVITIKERVKEPDGEAGFNTTWKSVKQVFAAIYPIKAVQQTDMKSVGVDATHHIKVRGHTVISENNRIFFGTREFEILFIENLQETNFLKLITCKERR